MHPVPAQIGRLLNRHQGQTAWVFGKGPSLDRFPMEATNDLRICVNESLLCVSDPTYFFAHDEVPIARVAQSWPKNCSAILQPVRGAYALRCGIPFEAIFTYDKLQGEWEILDMNAREIANRNCLFGLSGTVHSALHFCRLIGAGSLVLVGFDGAGPYAESLCMTLPQGGGQHDRIRRDSIHVLERLAIPFQFFSAENQAHRSADFESQNGHRIDRQHQRISSPPGGPSLTDGGSARSCH